MKIHKKSPKLLGQRIRKRYYETLGTSVINSPLSPLSLLHMYIAILGLSFSVYIILLSEKTEFSDFLIQPVGIWKKQL